MNHEPDFSQCRILIVDDQEPNRRLLGSLVETLGIERIEFAVDGLDGLAKLESFKPDLVLLDIMMPNMDGFAMCRELRARPEWRDLPVLVNTALSEPGERVECFRAGATDMVTKPINGPEVLARVSIHLERRLLIRDLSAYHERVAQELALAARMQTEILPGPKRLAELGGPRGLAIESHYAPSSELGGDYWEMLDLGPDRLGILLVDFSGHGVGAALNAFRLHALVGQNLPGRDSSPAAWLKSLNGALKGLLAPGQYATALFLVLDTAADRMVYASAAAPAPLLVEPGGEARLLDPSGFFLGILADVAYEDRELAFPPGARLLLYSDALTESPDAQDRPLGEEGLMDFVLADLKTPAPALPALVERIAARFPPPLPDDLTLVRIERVSVTS
jgi:sigma-B regulation protein RsbU (phosphoserine phosphatase)